MGNEDHAAKTLSEQWNEENPRSEIVERPLTKSGLKSLIEELLIKAADDRRSLTENEPKPESVPGDLLYSLIEKMLKRSEAVPKAILDQLLTYSDVAARLNVSERHVKKLKAVEKLMPAPLGGRMVRFSKEEVQRFLTAPNKSRRKKSRS